MIHYEGLWSFDSGTFQAVSNQYAAMPSIHFAWAFWCFLALRGRVRSGWGRVCLYLYPPLTLFAVVVTANHYWIDAVAGIACLLLALAWATPTGALEPTAPEATAGAWPARRRDRHHDDLVRFASVHLDSVRFASLRYPHIVPG